MNPDEKRRRIKLAVAAYAYEIANDPVMTDEQYDRLSRSIRPELMTGNLALDVFFATKFNPSTGMWVHHHPDQRGLKRIYDTIGPLIRDFNIEGRRFHML